MPAQEKGWKNVFKMRPGFMTKILVKFSYIHSNESYPFDVSAEPGYVYHCHVSIFILLFRIGFYFVFHQNNEKNHRNKIISS